MGYLWSERVIVSLKVVTSHNLIVLSCDPVAKLLPLGCTASDSMEFTCAFLLRATGEIWFLMRSCSREIFDPVDYI